MASPSLALRRRAPRLVLGSAYALLYGRALRLPPPALPSRAYPADSAVAAGLRRFRRRLHLQRAAVALLRALCLAALVASIILLLRVFGTDLPLPLAPLVGAGAVLGLVLVLTPWQRPAPLQMAHAIDERLRMREQIGSALVVDRADGRLAALLHQRAGQTLSGTDPARILPWPSLQRERIAFFCLCLLAGVSALLAVHAAPIRHLTAARAAQVAAARRGAIPRAAHAGSAPLRLLALGKSGQARLIGMAPAGRGAAQARVVRGASSAGHGLGLGRALPGGALTLHTGQGHAAAASGSGTRAGAGSPVQTGTGAGGRAASGAGQPSALHFTSGQNSSAGSLASPEQQALMNLQSSISSAQGQQGQSAGSSRSEYDPQGGSRGQSGATSGPNGRGRGQPGAAGSRNGPRGQGPTGPNGGSPYSRASGRYGRGLGGQAGAAGYDDPTNRLGRPGSGTGDQTGSAGSYNAPNSNGTTPSIGNGGTIVLDATPGKGSRLVLSIGQPNRSSAPGGSSVLGASTNAIVTVPGYVAPDSNTVNPDDRAAIQQYFSPQPSSQ